MKTGILSALMLVVLGVGFVRSGNYGQTREPASKASRASQRQVVVLGETPEYRVVKHAMGETRVPRQPRRIVSLSAGATDSLVALGFQPVLVESAWKSGKPAPYLADGLNGTVAVRRSGGIGLEAILDAKPDLILIGMVQDGKSFSQLSRIAPTVVLGATAPADRETVLLDVGDVLGVPDRARRRLAEYYGRVERGRAALAQCARGQPVVFLRFRQHTCVIYARTLMFGPLLFDRLGLTPDPAMPLSMSAGGWDVLSIERLSTLQAAHVFAVVDADSEAYYGYVTSTPIWRRLSAASSGRVHRVAASTWLGGDGVLANEAILGDVLTAMTPEGTPR